MHERSSKAQDFRCMIEMVVELTSHEKNNILYWVYPSLHRAEKKQNNRFFRRCNVYFWRINVLKMQKTNTTRKIGEKWATFKNTYNIPLYWLVYDKTHSGYSSIIYSPLYVASWRFQPLWKICSSNWILSPRIGVKKDCFKPPPSLCHVFAFFRRMPYIQHIRLFGLVSKGWPTTSQGRSVCL